MSTRILIVDDETPILDLLQEGLAEGGYEVHVAQDAATALALVKEHLYDAAILDFALPDMDGVMLHNEIRRMDRELAARTLFISGLDQDDEQIGYFQSAGSGFLPKPFELIDVRARLRNLLESQAD